MGIMKRMQDIMWAKVKERFMRNVLIAPDGCWIWQGGSNGGKKRIGYPTFHVLGASKVVYAHRLSYELFKGAELPDGMNVLHTCDTPMCVNPNHLVMGTQLENMQDKHAKGRASYPGMRQPLYGTDNAASKIDKDTVTYIRAEATKKEKSYRQIAEEIGISKSQVARIVKGHNWTMP